MAQRRCWCPGSLLLAIGLVGFARVPVDGSYLTDVLPVMIPIGIGAGLFFPSLTTLAVSGVPPSESGLASGLLNTTLQVGGAIGLAVLATLAASRTDDLAAGGASNASALVGGLPPRLPRSEAPAPNPSCSS